MKPEIDYYIRKDILLSDLEDLYKASEFIIYKKFNLSKKKLRKKLKKLISKIENNKIDECLELDDQSNPKFQEYK